MSLLANDFLVAASKTAKTTVQVKKGEKINSFSFDSKSTRDELKNDLVEAEEIYKQAGEKAMEVYEESIKQASRARKGAIEQAWQARKQSAEQAWTIFQGDKLGKGRSG